MEYMRGASAGSASSSASSGGAQLGYLLHEGAPSHIRASAHSGEPCLSLQTALPSHDDGWSWHGPAGLSNSAEGLLLGDAHGRDMQSVSCNERLRQQAEGCCRCGTWSPVITGAIGTVR